jgi:hypothetical protein
MKSLNKTLFIFFILFISLAYIESTIVVYLREIYYPNGFHFPIKIIENRIAFIEIGREAFTIIILWFSAMLTADKFKKRFAFFLYNFGLWDIFYYLWLKVLIDWPAGWLEWDILFLIPLPWIAPWLAPVLISIGFIVCSYILLKRSDRFKNKIFNKIEWLLEIVAASVILWSFFWQTKHVLNGGVPDYYPWWLFIFGIILGLGVFINRYKKPISEN